nr:hypothetical protein [Lysinibacillus timonensis]
MEHTFMHVSRIFLGILFLGAGINGFIVGLGFSPIAPTSPAAMELFEFEYLLFVEKGLEIICGILLLINRYIPFVIVVLSSIIVNILLLHIFLDLILLPLAILMSFAYVYLAHYYWHYFQHLFDSMAKRP